MSRYIISAAPIIYLLSTLVFQSTWSHFYQEIGIRHDLTPSQFRLMPLGMNLLAASFGLPALVFLLKNARSFQSGSRLYFVSAMVCVLSAILLIIGAVRWVLLDPESLSVGIGESFAFRSEKSQDQTEIQDGRFNSKRFGISLDMPEGWEVLSANTIRRANESGLTSITGRMQTPSQAQLPPEIDQFLAVKKHPEGFSGYNPSLALVSYEKNAMKRQGVVSLSDLVRQWARAGHPYTIVAAPTAETVGKFDGIVVRLKADFGGMIVQQHIHAFETERYYVSATVSYQELKDRSILELVLKSIQKNESAQQDGNGQPATRSESKSEGSDKPQPEAEGLSR